MELIERELKNIVEVLRKWDIFKIEYKRTFIRGDGLPMLYVKAKSDKYYIHIEGIIKAQELECYIKLTEGNKNKHSHKDEIIGWDNLYEDRPHIHFDEDEKREYREEEISWDEIKETIIKIMREGE